MRRQLGFTAVAATLALTVSVAKAQITDDFETDTSASYTVFDDSNAPSGDGTADSTIVFNFDYSALGIPQAPNSAPGDGTFGLVMAANNSEDDPNGVGQTTTEEDHVTAFHNTSITGSHRLDVDVYLSVDFGQPGTTEYAHVGVAGNGTDYTSLFNPVVANGHFIAFNGDGDSGSDYRHSTPSTPAVPSGDPTYLNGENTTQSFGNIYLDLFPSTERPGSPTNIWTTLTITAVEGGLTTYWLDDRAIIQTPTEAVDGFISLGYADLFDSVGPNLVVYDNLSVTAIPEPTSALLALAGLAGVARRRR